MTDAPLLDVRDLHVTYPSSEGDVPAVRGVSFTLRAGETLGLAGESGCGKSTIAAAMLRLLPAGTKVEGEVLLDGEDVFDDEPGPPPRRALDRGRDRVPGRAARAQPGAEGEAPDRRGDPAPRPDRRQGDRRRGSASCSSRSACPAAAPTPTRTSCPAVNASA